MRPKPNTNHSSSDPKDRRGHRKIEAKAAWRDAVRATGKSDAAIAAELGVCETTVRNFGDAQKDAWTPLADVKGLPLEGRIAIARWLLGDDGYDVVKLPEPADIDCGLRLAAEAHREHAEALGCLLRGVGGYIDASTGADLERESDEAIAPLLTMREIGRRAQRERFLAVPMKTGAAQRGQS